MSKNSYELLYVTKKSNFAKTGHHSLPLNLSTDGNSNPLPEFDNKTQVKSDRDSGVEPDLRGSLTKLSNGFKAVDVYSTVDNDPTHLFQINEHSTTSSINVVLNSKDWQNIEIYRRNKAKSRTESKQQSTKIQKSFSTVMKELANSVIDNGKLSLVSSQIHKFDKINEKLGNQIKTLYLSNNYIKDFNGIDCFPNLQTISITNNLIRYLSHLNPLASLKNLQKLSLEGNDVCHMPYYQEYILHVCPSLILLDHHRIHPDHHQSSKSKIRKIYSLFDQLRVNSFHNCILSHISNLLSVHSQILLVVMGRFRSFRSSHMPSSDDCRLSVYVSPSRVLQAAMHGGVFRWLQIAAGTDFDYMMQDFCFAAFLVVQKKLPAQTRTKVSQSLSLQSQLWDEIVGQVLQHQQKQTLEIIESCGVAQERRAGVINQFLSSTNNQMFLRQSKEESVLKNISFESPKARAEQLASEGKESAEDAVTSHVAVLGLLQQIHFDSINTSTTEYRKTYCGLGLHHHPLPIHRPAPASAPTPVAPEARRRVFPRASEDLLRRSRSQSPNANTSARDSSPQTKPQNRPLDKISSLSGQIKNSKEVERRSANSRVSVSECVGGVEEEESSKKAVQQRYLALLKKNQRVRGSRQKAAAIRIESVADEGEDTGDRVIQNFARSSLRDVPSDTNIPRGRNADQGHIVKHEIYDPPIGSLKSFDEPRTLTVPCTPVYVEGTSSVSILRPNQSSLSARKKSPLSQTMRSQSKFDAAVSSTASDFQDLFTFTDGDEKIPMEETATLVSSNISSQVEVAPDLSALVDSVSVQHGFQPSTLPPSRAARSPDYIGMTMVSTPTTSSRQYQQPPSRPADSADSTPKLCDGHPSRHNIGATRNAQPTLWQSTNKLKQVFEPEISSLEQQKAYQLGENISKSIKISSPIINSDRSIQSKDVDPAGNVTPHTNFFALNKIEGCLRDVDVRGNPARAAAGRTPDSVITPIQGFDKRDLRHSAVDTNLVSHSQDHFNEFDSPVTHRIADDINAESQNNYPSTNHPRADANTQEGTSWPRDKRTPATNDVLGFIETEKSPSRGSRMSKRTTTPYSRFFQKQPPISSDKENIIDTDKTSQKYSLQRQGIDRVRISDSEFVPRRPLQDITPLHPRSSPGQPITSSHSQPGGLQDELQVLHSIPLEEDQVRNIYVDRIDTSRTSKAIDVAAEHGLPAKGKKSVRWEEQQNGRLALFASSTERSSESDRNEADMTLLSHLNDSIMTRVDSRHFSEYDNIPDGPSSESQPMGVGRLSSNNDEESTSLNSRKSIIVNEFMMEASPIPKKESSSMSPEVAKEEVFDEETEETNWRLPAIAVDAIVAFISKQKKSLSSTSMNNHIEGGLSNLSPSSNMAELIQQITTLERELWNRHSEMGSVTSANERLQFDANNVHSAVVLNAQRAEVRLDSKKESLVAIRNEIINLEDEVGVAESIFHSLEESRTRLAQVQIVHKDMQRENSELMTLVAAEKNRHEQLLRAEREVSDAVDGIQAELGKSSTIQSSIREHHVTQLAETFFRSTALWYSRRIALYGLLYRCRRQKMIRNFAQNCNKRRNLERILFVFEAWCVNTFRMKAVTRFRRLKELKLIRLCWTALSWNYGLSRRIKLFLKMKSKKKMVSGFRNWTQFLVYRKAVAAKEERLECKYELFITKQCFYGWKAYIQKVSLQHPNPETESFNLEKARFHFLQTTFHHWNLVCKRDGHTLKRLSSLITSKRIGLILSKSLFKWASLLLGSIQYKKIKRICAIKAWNKRALYNHHSKIKTQEAGRFYIMRSLFLGLESFHQYAQRQGTLRQQGCVIQHRYERNTTNISWMIWVEVYRKRVIKRERNEMAISFYIESLMRKTFNRLQVYVKLVRLPGYVEYSTGFEAENPGTIYAPHNCSSWSFQAASRGQAMTVEDSSYPNMAQSDDVCCWTTNASSVETPNTDDSQHMTHIHYSLGGISQRGSVGDDDRGFSSCSLQSSECIEHAFTMNPGCREIAVGLQESLQQTVLSDEYREQDTLQYSTSMDEELMDGGDMDRKNGNSNKSVDQTTGGRYQSEITNSQSQNSFRRIIDYKDDCSDSSSDSRNSLHSLPSDGDQYASYASNKMYDSDTATEQSVESYRHMAENPLNYEQYEDRSISNDAQSELSVSSTMILGEHHRDHYRLKKLMRWRNRQATFTLTGLNMRDAQITSMACRNLVPEKGLTSSIKTRSNFIRSFQAPKISTDKYDYNLHRCFLRWAKTTRHLIRLRRCESQIKEKRNRNVKRRIMKYFLSYRLKVLLSQRKYYSERRKNAAEPEIRLLGLKSQKEFLEVENNKLKQQIDDVSLRIRTVDSQNGIDSAELHKQRKELLIIKNYNDRITAEIKKLEVLCEDIQQVFEIREHIQESSTTQKINDDAVESVMSAMPSVPSKDTLLHQLHGLRMQRDRQSALREQQRLEQNKKLGCAEETIKNLRSSIRESEERIQSLQKQRSEMYVVLKDCQRVMKVAVQKITDETSTRENERKSLESEIEQLKQENVHLEKQEKALRETLEQLRLTLADLRQQEHLRQDLKMARTEASGLEFHTRVHTNLRSAQEVSEDLQLQSTKQLLRVLQDSSESQEDADTSTRNPLLMNFGSQVRNGSSDRVVQESYISTMLAAQSEVSRSRRKESVMLQLAASPSTVPNSVPLTNTFSLASSHNVPRMRHSNTSENREDIKDVSNRITERLMKPPP